MKIKNNQKRPSHLVNPSLWPIVAAIGGLTLTIGGVMYMHNYANGVSTLIFVSIIVFFATFTERRNIIKKNTLEGQNISAVRKGLRMIMIFNSLSVFLVAVCCVLSLPSPSPVYQIVDVVCMFLFITIYWWGGD
jgi:hypothetical protein